MSDFDGILRSGERLPEGLPYVPADPDQVFWGRLPARGDAPVLTVESGAEVVVDTLSHEGLLPDQGSDAVAFFAGHGVGADEVLAEAVALSGSDRRDPASDGPHVVTGPIEVAGAKPGDVVAVTLLDATPRVPYGVISNRHGRGALPDEMPAGGADAVSVFAPISPDADGTWKGRLPRRDGGPRDVSFPLAPFLGIMGVATDTDERAHSVPPGAHGGNIDIKELVVGSTLYLPVQVPGALAYVGDPHFAQGDGEVALTALEASLRVRIRLDLIPAREAARAFGDLVGPLGETSTHLMPTGIDADLDEAVRKATRAAIAILSARYGMEAHLAYAYLSAATDLRISQVVDLVCGAHAMIRKEDFEASDASVRSDA
ncbi:acetamidase/formamidase family protein [Demequina zhanjiangensis]|uniref:Acetamidase/formamidase family protein n=1 Tax=Demequina zhanjiangensis TaxID=3051659 RepID=A0ABT8FY42_9MICO|nr:acetamidase/formamidase family protein [Demequina sp. SYSU T00b26]MDN4471821.1 acetamidase/formamidase family protein [Demequina sp. SYSU T00b26]